MYVFEQLFNFDFNSSGELVLCIVTTIAFSILLPQKPV